MNRRLKKTISMICFASVLTTALSNFRYKEVEASTEKLKKLIIDKVPVLEYDSSKKVYEGTAYLSAKTINIYPFTNDSNADVKVNNNALKNGGSTVELVEGENNIKITVDGTEYTVKINKVNSDYRGRTPINSSKIERSSEFGGDLDKMFDGDLNTAWSPTNTPTDETEANKATSFILDLGKVKWVSRIVADMGGNGYPLWKNMVRISTSKDKINWETPVIKGNMREDQKNVRYEFGKSYEARYIKYEIIKFNQPSLAVNEFTVYEDPNGAFPTYPAPEGGDKPFVPDNPNIASGQETVIQKGFPISGWMASEGYGRGTPTKEESKLFGWDGPLFYDPELSNESFMLNNPDALWGLAKAPWGDNGMANAGEPKEFVPESLKPYINNAINFCFGDEGIYNVEEAKRFKKWFEYSKENYPGTIVHSNQAAGRQWEGKFKEYMQIAEPDMLSYDDYYYWQDAGTNQWNYVYQALNTNLWKEQREAALLGVDGTGTKPILFGQYLDIWKLDQQESMKNLIVNLSMLTGMKWLNHFRLEYQFDGCYLFDEDGTPTHGLYEWGEVNRYLKVVDDYILLLNNDYVITKPGKHGSGEGTLNNIAKGWHMGAFNENLEKNKEFGITDIVAENNVPTTNNGLPGDVVLGYFNALPGLYPEQLTEKFGCDAPKAFMVLNGLIDGSAGRWNNSNIIGKEAGSEENTIQTITITVDPQGRELKKVNRNTGVVENVAVSENNQLSVTLGGGEAELFFWVENNNVEASSEFNNQPAYFAFDNNANTYWKPANIEVAASVEKTFKLQTLDRIIINEIGDNVSSYKLEYKAEDDTWIQLGDEGTSIGGNLDVNGKGVKAKGLRLTINSANSIPEIRDIRYYGDVIEGSVEEEVKTITINDNVMGTGINMFSYDDTWSYRENENNQGLEGIQDKDVHFSNFNSSEAKFKFYGTAVELVFRNNNGNGKFNISIDGGEPEAFTTTGTGETTISKKFEDLEQKVHEVVIKKTDEAQAAIDCAKVSYSGELIQCETEYQVYTYVNDKDKGTEINKINYSAEPVTTSDRSGDVTSKAAEGFASWTQNNETNIGFTATDKVDSYYEIKFNGTDLVIYGGQKASFDNDGQWGTFEYSIDDGEVQTGTYENINNDGNPNISLPVLKINASDENQEHTVKIINKSGRTRLDYAVAVEKAVPKIPEEPEESVNKYTVSASVAGNGAVTPDTLTVNEHGNAIFTVTPAEGYNVSRATAIGKTVTIDGNIVTVHDVTGDINLSIIIDEIIPDVISKEELQSKYEEARTIEKLNYKGSSYLTLQKEMDRAKAILDKDDATSSEIKGIYISLRNAINDLAIAEETTPKAYPTETSVFIDNTDPSIVYNGSWTNGEGAWATNKYMNSMNFTDSPTISSITIPFMGTGISIYMESKSESAKMNVIIKDINNNEVAKQEGIVLASPDAVPTTNKLAYTISDIKSGEYTATLTFTHGNRAALDGVFVETASAAEETFNVTFNKNVENTTVLVKDLDGNIIEANKDGSYTLKSGEYTYSASAEGYDSITDVKFTVANEDKEIDITLEKVEEPEKPVYKKDLEIAISEAEKVTEEELSKVIPVVREEFIAALEEAKGVFADENARQEVVNKSFERLSKVMQMLSFERGDKTHLIDLANSIKELESKKDEYIATTWDSLQVVLAKANSVIADENAMDKEVNETYEELLRVFLNLKLKPNKDKLQDLINKAEALDKNKYTKETWTELIIKLENAKNIMNDENVSQDDVNKAEKELDDAINSLIEVADTSDSNGDDQSNSNNGTGNSSSNLPETGGRSSAMIGLGGLITTALGVIVLKKRRNASK